MNASLEQLCQSLDNLSNKITTAYTADTTLTDAWGWSMPPLNRHDLAVLPQSMASKIRAIGTTDLSEELTNQIDEIPEKIDQFITVTLPYLYNGNGNHSSAAYFALLDWINQVIDPLFSWESLSDNRAMPAQLKRRLRGIQSDLDSLIPSKEDLEEQIKLIKEATETAESLPTDLESLKQARAEVNQFSSNSAELYGKIDTYFKEIETTAKNIADKYIEAEAIVKQCNEAYRVTTSKGLAGAFDQRATRLSSSMWVWVLGLLIALGLGAWIGAHRVELLSNLIMSPSPQWGGIWIHLVLSILSISAPIWFAWLATKQINQRFRLSEDYAFKASVAKAYEGYRREAARIDEAFEARLFSSTLSRLEEAPLRLVEADPHGSPWHELFSSESFRSALETVPEFKEAFLSMAKKGLSKVPSKTESKDVDTPSV